MVLKKQIKFIKDFASPSLGMVWVNRVVTLPNNEATKFVENGLAEFVAPKRGRPKNNAG
jgi:hypothetical protein